MTTDLNRRKFLRHAGTGTIALAGASVLIGESPASAHLEHQDGIGFFFAALDSAGPVHDPTSPDLLLMQGCGQFDDKSRRITGSGWFTQFEGNSPLAPKPIKQTGFWEAHRLVSFHAGPAFGVQLTGIMVAEVKLLRQSPQPKAFIPATLKVVCNNPFIPFSTGEPEGFELVIGSLTFSQLTPTIGISGFDDQRLRDAD